jgi:hypothetical protein
MKEVTDPAIIPLIVKLNTISPILVGLKYGPPYGKLWASNIIPFLDE